MNTDESELTLFGRSDEYGRLRPSCTVGPTTTHSGTCGAPVARKRARRVREAARGNPPVETPAGRPGPTSRLFSSRQSTTAFSGGCRYSPTTSRTLASSSGSVENLNVSTRQGCSFQSRQIRATMAKPTPSSAASSRLDQCVTPSRCGGGVSVAATTCASSTRRGRPDRLRSCSAASPPRRSGPASGSRSGATPPPAPRSRCSNDPPRPAARSGPAAPARLESPRPVPRNAASTLSLPGLPGEQQSAYGIVSTRDRKVTSDTRH